MSLGHRGATDASLGHRGATDAAGVAGLAGEADATDGRVHEKEN